MRRKEKGGRGQEVYYSLETTTWRDGSAARRVTSAKGEFAPLKKDGGIWTGEHRTLENELTYPITLRTAREGLLKESSCAV